MMWLEVVVIIAAALIVSLVVGFWIKRKLKGESGCKDCSCCPHCSACKSKANNQKTYTVD